MADILGIGSSGLLAYRSALNVVGQNIANANTEGYSRQRVNLEARPLSGGSVPSGNGVTVRDVQRISDQFVVNRLTGQDSSLARVNTMATQTAQLDTWLSDSTTGLGAPLSAFFDSLNDLSADPASTANRQSVISDAQSLATRPEACVSRLPRVAPRRHGTPRCTRRHSRRAASAIPRSTSTA